MALPRNWSWCVSARPSATESFDKTYRRCKALAAYLCRYLFVCEDSLLRINDIEVADEPNFVALEGNFLGSSRIQHCTRLGLRFAIQVMQCGELILHFLICDKDSLFVLREALSIRGLCLLDPRSQSSSSEDWRYG